MIDALLDEVRRDRWGRYVVLAPGGKKPEGYTRATTIAKALDDTSNLMAWGRRMAAIGFAQRPDLLALLQATEPTNKKKLDQLCERASEAGGATARRDLGTAIHKMFEESCVTPGYTVPQPYTADVTAIHACLEANEFRVVDGCTELMVVVDKHKIAGMADLIIERKHDSKLFIADLKTGSSVEFGALGWAIQLAIYAHADNIYIQGPDSDGSTDLRAPMVQVSQDEAFIIHCEPESGTATLHTLDIAAGWEALQTAISVRDWRKKRKLLVPFVSAGGQATDEAVVAPTEPAASTTDLTAEVGTPAVSSDVGEGTASSVVQYAPSPTSHISAEEAAIIERDHMLLLRRLWLLERIKLIGEQGFITSLQDTWPEACAGPKAVRMGEAVWNIAETAAVVKCVDAVEMLHDMPFGAIDPELAHRFKVEETARMMQSITNAEPRRQTPA